MGRILFSIDERLKRPTIPGSPYTAVRGGVHSCPEEFPEGRPSIGQEQGS